MSGNNLDSLSREKKKNQLRRQMLSTQNRPPVLRPEDDRDHSSEDSEEIVEKARRKVLRRRLTIFGVLLVLLGTAAFGFYQYQRRHQYSGYSTLWETSMNEGDYSSYVYYGSNVLKYNNNGATYYDNQGKLVWTKAYEIKAPAISIQGDYVAIADQRATTIYIIGKDGTAGVASTPLPISKITVADNGVVAAVLEESTASYVNFFKRDGTQLDIQIKVVMGGEGGYPLDIAFSHGGTQMIGSYVYLKSGELKNRVAFHDFSEIGKNKPTRLVAAFEDEFDKSMAARVHFMADPYSCAFTVDKLVFFSSKNLAIPALIKTVDIEEEIQSIFYSDEYAGVVVRTGKGENPYRVDVYSKKGDPVMSREFDYDYTNVDVDGDLVFIYNEESCRVYNMAGVLKLETTFDFPVAKIRKGRFPNTLLVTGPQDMKEIKMQ